MKIIEYQEKYRDDLIYMVLNAKVAIGRLPRINEEFLHMQESYFDKGQCFFLALNEFDRVIGCIGTKFEDNKLFLSHLFVNVEYKRKGIGSKLLEKAENFAREKGYHEIHVHLGESYLESHVFYPKHGYKEYKKDYLKKQLIIKI